MKTVRVVLWGAAMALLATLPASAFKPNEAGHLGITTEALSATSRVVDGETLRFSDRAVKQVRDANKDTDCLSCQAEASFHFDDESFAAGTARLIALRDSIIARITAASPDGAAARKDLGGALHTLQDFYAHSSWVELGLAGIDTQLGRSTFSGLPLTTATCPADPAVLGGAGSSPPAAATAPSCPRAGCCRRWTPASRTRRSSSSPTRPRRTPPSPATWWPQPTRSASASRLSSSARAPRWIPPTSASPRRPGGSCSSSAARRRASSSSS